MKFSFRQFIVPHFWKKFWLCLGAILMMGFFLSFLIEIGWGTDPATFMNLNLSHIIGWTFGNWQLVINLVMLTILFIFDSDLIGFGTIFNMVLIGYVSDFCRWIWKLNGFHDYIIAAPLNEEIGIFAVAIVMFVIVAAVYMNAQMGLSPYDGDAKLLTIVLSKIRVPFWLGRMIYDYGVILIGFIASLFSPDGMQGSVIGVCIIGLLLGPVISLMGKWMGKTILNFEEE